jgi:predicted nucleic acid-binding protein
VPLDAVVADANVLLSAVVGGAADRVFSDFSLEVHVMRFNAREIEAYLPRMAAKYALPLPLVRLRWKLLPLLVHDLSRYKSHYPGALKDMENRDPEDAHALALARATGLPLWSSDRDLAGLGVAIFTTAKLLKVLEKGEIRRE